MMQQENCCNPLKLWHDLGEPAYPTGEETELIKSAAHPLVESSIVYASGKTQINVPVGNNGVVYFTLTERHLHPTEVTIMKRLFRSID